MSRCKSAAQVVHSSLEFSRLSWHITHVLCHEQRSSRHFQHRLLVTLLAESSSALCFTGCRTAEESSKIYIYSWNGVWKCCRQNRKGKNKTKFHSKKIDFHIFHDAHGKRWKELWNFQWCKYKERSHQHKHKPRLPEMRFPIFTFSLYSHTFSNTERCFTPSSGFNGERKL